MGPWDAGSAEHSQEIDKERGSDGSPITYEARKPAREEIANDGRGDDQKHRRVGEVVLPFGAPAQDFWQISQMLLVPKHKGPMRGERHPADQRDPERDPARFAAEQVPDTGRAGRAATCPTCGV